MALGFLVSHFSQYNPRLLWRAFCQAHGYATAEFEVTEERLGVYLPVSFQAILTCIDWSSYPFRPSTSTIPKAIPITLVTTTQGCEVLLMYARLHRMRGYRF